MTGRRAGAAAVLVAALAAAGCAKSVFPPGGPPDTTPPKVLAATPADSSVRVARDAGVTFLFSEPMDHPSVRDAVKIFPPPPHLSYKWTGRLFRIRWADPLRSDATYQVLLSARARDAHGVMLGNSVAVRFSTGDSLAPGRISGIVRARTLPRKGVPIFVFPDSVGTRPDTTDFEPTYAAETDTSAAYELAGLALGQGYRLFLFYDRNANGAFDDQTDLLIPYPEAIRLTPERSVADSINFVAVDPRAPAVVSGTIAASDSTAQYRVEARGVPDSTNVRRVDRIGPGAFTLRVPTGSYTLRASRVPGPDGTPARLELTRSDVLEVKAEEEQGGFTFDFRPLDGGAPSQPPPEKGDGP
ncbi:MAG TPA: Ig-like domain-containing protein [Candidatus Eisenbacteria bacterium]